MFEHVLKRERLKIKFVARGRNPVETAPDGVTMIVSKSCLAAATRRATAVIKLNSLADPVGATAQNHDFALAALPPLVLVAVSRVVIGCKLELLLRMLSTRSRSVDAATVSGNDTFSFSLLLEKLGFFRKRLAQRANDCSVREPSFFASARYFRLQTCRVFSNEVSD